ncbi:MAG: JmjC domain-containing protein [Actinomycetota bacterium]
MSTPTTARAVPRVALPDGLAALAAAPGARLGHRVPAAAPLHPETLARLCARVPPAWVGGTAVQSDPRAVRCLAARHPDPVAAVRGDAATPGYVSLANLELLAEFADLARAIEHEVRACVGADEGGVTRVNLGALVSPPGSVVPVHADQHHNLLLQVTGTKAVWVEAEPDRRRHDARVHAHYRTPTDPVALPPARSVVLEPGSGVYIPPDGFHWVVVGDEPSVGLSVGFSTVRTEAVVDARRVDRALDRWGLPVRGRAHPGGRTTAVKAALRRVGRPRD